MKHKEIMNRRPHVYAALYFFPPKKAIGCVRNSIVMDLFHLNKFDVTVLSPVSEKDVQSPYTIHRIKAKDIKSLVKKKISISSVKSTSTTRKLLNSFPFNIFLNEGGIGYILRASWFLWKHRKEDIILYTSYSPLADHYIGYIAKKMNRNIFWIADFRDILVDYDVKNIWMPNLFEMIHKNIIQNANIVTVVSSGLKDFFLDYNKNIFVLRNGIYLDDLVYDKEFVIDRNYFHITYTGALYGGRRSPELLFKALVELRIRFPNVYSRVRINYAGKEGELWINLCKKYGVDDRVKNLGMLERRRAIALQNQSQLNLLLSWSTPNNRGILTGKFYEYIAARMPILCILTGSHDSEFDMIFEKFDYSFLFYQNEDRTELLVGAIISLFEIWEKGNYQDVLLSEDEIKPFMWDKAFSDFLLNLNFQNDWK